MAAGVGGTIGQERPHTCCPLGSMLAAGVVLGAAVCRRVMQMLSHSHYVVQVCQGVLHSVVARCSAMQASARAWHAQALGGLASRCTQRPQSGRAPWLARPTRWP